MMKAFRNWRRGKGEQDDGHAATDAPQPQQQQPPKRLSVRKSITTNNKKTMWKGAGHRVKLQAEMDRVVEAIFPPPQGLLPLFDDDDDDVANKTTKTVPRDPEEAARLLQGTAVVEPEKRVVRFFMSSTFTDTKWERDVFFAACVPLLRELCESRGLEFQMSEMRWGINDTLSATHQTSETCMRELARCQRDSVAVNFVGLLGNKYGYRPFPAEIQKALFEQLLQQVPPSLCGGNLLTKWFKLDENRDAYVLVPVTDLIPKYNPSVTDKHSQKWWSECFEPMQAGLHEAARLLVAAGDLDEKEALPFVQSVTEDEMRRGFVKDSSKTLLIRSEEHTSELQSPT